MSDERRKSSRQKSFLRGRINNGLSDVDCLIRDLSGTGARLIFSGGINMPSVIDLYIPVKKQVMRAQVQWRNGDEMGVSFLEDAKGDTAPTTGDYSELAERVVKLEAEIAALRKIVLMRGEGSSNQSIAKTA